MPIRRRRRRYGGRPHDPDADALDYLQERGELAAPRHAPMMHGPTKLKWYQHVPAYLKRNKIVSRGLRAVGARNLAEKVSQAGYGRRRYGGLIRV